MEGSIVRYYCLLVLLFFCQSTQAQMYQWNDPETGTTQLSGKPPAWYRSVEGGPRVFVFNRGKVVDDTGIDISDEQRMALRTNAFVRAEEDRLAAKEKAMEAAKLKAMMDRNVDTTSGQKGEDSELSDQSQEIVVLEGPDETEIGEEAIDEGKDEDNFIEKMKALIAGWDNKRTEEAMILLLQGSPEK